MNNEISLLQNQAREGENFKEQFYNLDKKMQKVITAFEKRVGELERVQFHYSL
jgi:ABC-type uncharacterized transport system fused permease/ATPase subunit